METVSDIIGTGRGDWEGAGGGGVVGGCHRTRPDWSEPTRGSLRPLWSSASSWGGETKRENTLESSMAKKKKLTLKMVEL